MRDLAIVFVHLVVTLALGEAGWTPFRCRRIRVGPASTAILNRRRKRAPNLRATDRINGGLVHDVRAPGKCPSFAIVLKPSTLPTVSRKPKYRSLFSLGRRRRPSAEETQQDLGEAVVAMKRRNPG